MKFDSVKDVATHLQNQKDLTKALKEHVEKESNNFSAIDSRFNTLSGIIENLTTRIKVLEEKEARREAAYNNADF